MIALDIQELSISFEDAIAYLNLPLVRDHKDPFDRILVAQAITRSLIIVSADKKLDAYEVQRLWG